MVNNNTGSSAIKLDVSQVNIYLKDHMILN